jgi:hypothetical protein
VLRCSTKMAMTFKSLSQHADFTVTSAPEPEKSPILVTTTGQEVTPKENTPADQKVTLGGLVYNVQLILPADRDPAVYDALFKSLKEHLLK